MDSETIFRTPLLPNDECNRLIARWQDHGDNLARDKICRAYYRLAWGIASQYKSAHGRDFLDVVQEGMLGLLKAIDRFDRARGVMFSTYAPFWVRAGVRIYLRDKLGIVRVLHTADSRRAFSNIRHTMMTMRSQGEETTNEAIAARLGVPEAAVVRAKSAIFSQRPLSTDAPIVRSLRDGQTVLSRASLELGEASPEDLTVAEEEKTRSAAAICRFRETLTDREKLVLDTRLLAEQPEKLAAIGKRFGVTRERVRQIEVAIKHRLRLAVEAQSLAEDARVEANRAKAA